MVDWEEINNTLNYLGEVFIQNWWRIISYSAVIFLSLPIIKWFILSILYMVFKTDYLLAQFGESTAFNLLPWWVDLLTDPIGSLIGFVFIILLVTCVIALLQKEE